MLQLERLKQENHDWADKLQSAELQVKAISDEYRAKLEESQVSDTHSYYWSDEHVPCSHGNTEAKISSFSQC